MFRVIALGVAMGSVGLVAQQSWMPPAAAEGVAREMAVRLERIKVGIEPAKLLPSARAGVDGLRERLDGLGRES